MNDEEHQRERLGKLVALAKRGIGGERDTALEMVKKLCKKLHLEFEDVMSSDEKIREFYVDFARADMRLALHVVIRYAFDGDGTQDWVPSVSHTRLYFTTTLERYLETVHALEILTRQYRKEQKRVRKAFWYGFLSKHDLYAKKTIKSEEWQPSKEEMRERKMGSMMAHGMEDAEIRKALPPSL